MIKYEMHDVRHGLEYIANSPADGRNDAEKSALAAAEFEPVGESICMGCMVVVVIEVES